MNESGLMLMGEFDNPIARKRMEMVSPERTTIDEGELGEDRLYLDSDDPFEAAVIELVRMNRRKRRDYAEDGDGYSNFRTTAMGTGLDPEQVMLVNVMQKAARLKSLRRNGRMNEPANESVIDTYLDLAVYAVILYSFVKLYSEIEKEE